jgi:23S rRNA pseudouridine1911/1915/1917 synthase
MNLSKTFHVPAEATKQRLDVFIVEQLQISRSQAQKMIEQGQILVNDKPPKKPGDQIKGGDSILCYSEPKNEAKNKNTGFKNTTTKQPTAETKKNNATLVKGAVTIIAETQDYIVVDKPTGLLTHPTLAEEENSLASYLVKKYPEIKDVGENPVRPGIVHRLDKDASGLLVVARTPAMFVGLKKQFKKRTVEKEYLVLVHGRVAKDVDTINFPIARSKTTARMAARPQTYTGMSNELPLPVGEKEALTEFIVEKRFVNFTLLRVSIHTGRMHQIRVHLLAYNHPVVGDPIYFQKKRKNVWDKKLGRLFLHATQLSFSDLEKQRQTFNSPLPQQLQEFLQTLT